MRTKIRKTISVVALGFLLVLTGQSRASTFVSGSVSGTWITAGSPYVATDNLTVPNGETLTIQPGVTLIMGQGLKLDVEGAITAIGTAGSPIIIRGANSSMYWDKLYINYTTGAQSSFVNCNISEATNCIYLNIEQITATMDPRIENCVFSNCVDTCISAVSSASFTRNILYYLECSTVLNGLIANCRFESSSNGIHLHVDGNYDPDWFSGTGAINTVVRNNNFQDISGTAVQFEIGEVTNGSLLLGPSNPKLINSILRQCGIGVLKVGSSSSFHEDLSYNCFYANSTNFVGYPAGIYGTICCVNARGTNCDLANNIFVDPLFANPTDYTLAENSPCIDAGSLDWALTDMCFPPSQGTAMPDLGTYGGPNAANWLSVVPKVSAQLSLSKSNSLLWLNWGAIPRSSYQVQFLATNLNATSGTNKWLNGSTVVAADRPMSIAVSPYPATNSNAFYRLKNLGRVPGN